MADLVKELKHFYPNRYIIFDLPPVLSYADALAFAPLVDGIILVAEAASTPRENILQCLERLKGLPLVGFVLNKMESKDQSYYHRYYAYHYREKTAPKINRFLKWFRK
jgi:Mrp family chromosome partitioning ATPase